MRGRLRKLAALALVLAGMGLLGGCGDDEPTGPQFGDLVFSPSFVSLPGNDRDTVLVLRNRGSRDLGPIVIGVDFIIKVPSTLPDTFCTGARVNFVPSSISSLAGGAEETVAVAIDLSGPEVTPTSCPVGQYDVNVFAFVNNQGLGAATIRFDWDGTPP